MNAKLAKRFRKEAARLTAGHSGLNYLFNKETGQIRVDSFSTRGVYLHLKNERRLKANQLPNFKPITAMSFLDKVIDRATRRLQKKLDQPV